MDDTSNIRRDFLNRAKAIAVEHFNSSAHEYDTVFHSIGPIHAACLEEFLSRLGSSPAILDAACGTGRFFDALSSRAGRLVGIDQSVAMLGQALAKRPGIATRHLSLQELGDVAEFQGAFDGLVCIDAMEWVLRDDWPIVLAGFNSVLTSGGYAYLTIEIPGAHERRELSQPPAEGAVPGEIRVHDWYNHFPSANAVARWVVDADFDLEYQMEGEYYWHIILRKRS